MKNLFALFGFAVLLTSCETEIDVTAEWEDVTVVYGLLDPGASENWIRVERGYLGDAPAEASFNKPDSLYYDTLDVSLEALDDNGEVVNTITLDPDDSKELRPGEFTTENYRLYRTGALLNHDFRYRLSVKKPGTDFPETSAVTQLVEPASEGFRLKNPNSVMPIPYFNGNISWSASDNAEIYEIDLYFYYEEFDLVTGESVDKIMKLDYETITGSAAQAVGSAQEVSSNVPLSSFYERIAGNMPVDEGKLRFFQEMEIVVWAGGEDLATYIQLNEPSAGVGQGRPEFPQVVNGTGLLSSRTRTSLGNIQFQREFMQQFYLHPSLCDRRFAVREGLDTCFCERIGEDIIKECL